MFCQLLDEAAYQVSRLSLKDYSNKQLEDASRAMEDWRRKIASAITVES